MECSQDCKEELDCVGCLNLLGARGIPRRSRRVCVGSEDDDIFISKREARQNGVRRRDGEIREFGSGLYQPSFIKIPSSSSALLRTKETPSKP